MGLGFVLEAYGVLGGGEGSVASRPHVLFITSRCYHTTKHPSSRSRRTVITPCAVLVTSHAVVTSHTVVTSRHVTRERASQAAVSHLVVTVPRVSGRPRVAAAQQLHLHLKMMMMAAVDKTE